MSKLAHAGASSTTPSGSRQRASARAPRRPSTPPRRPAPTSASASRTSGARFADRDHRAAARRERLAQLAEIAALEPAADDRDQPASKLSIDRARRLDVGRLRVVDEPHAADLGDRAPSRARGRETPRPRAVIAPARAPAIAPTAAAATTSLSRWRPEQLDRAERHQRRRRRPRPLRRSQPPSTTMPSAIGAVERRTARARARVPRQRHRAPRSSALTTAQSSGVWFAKIRAFAAAYASTSGCRSRWSGEKFSITAIHGWNVVDRLELEAARLDDVQRVAASSRRPARSAARRCCRRPARLNPAASSIRPVSAVVVDLPLVPVIAIDAARAASATRARARR